MPPPIIYNVVSFAVQFCGLIVKLQYLGNLSNGIKVHPHLVEQLCLCVQSLGRFVPLRRYPFVIVREEGGELRAAGTGSSPVQGRS